MSDIKSSPNRVVRTKDSTIAFIGHNQQANEDVLIECFVDAASNAVSFKSSSKARYGKEFVEANEDVQVLIDYTNELVQQQIEAGVALPGVTPGHSMFNPGHVVNEPAWKKLGFKNEEKWIKAGSPEAPEPDGGAI